MELNLEKFTPLETQLRQAAADYSGLVITGVDDVVNYNAVKKALALVIKMRTGIETARVAIKAPAIQFGRDVDQKAKDLTAIIDGVERSLRGEKNRIDTEIQVAKEAKERAELERFKKRTDSLFEAGFVYNGTAYVAGEIAIYAEAIGNLSDDDFNGYVVEGKNQIDAAIDLLKRERINFLENAGFMLNGRHYELYNYKIAVDAVTNLSNDRFMLSVTEAMANAKVWKMVNDRSLELLREGFTTLDDTGYRRGNVSVSRDELQKISDEQFVDIITSGRLDLAPPVPPEEPFAFPLTPGIGGTVTPELSFTPGIGGGLSTGDVPYYRPLHPSDVPLTIAPFMEDRFEAARAGKNEAFTAGFEKCRADVLAILNIPEKTTRGQIRDMVIELKIS